MAGTKGEVSAFAAVEKLESTNSKARREGLNALERIFSTDRSYHRIDELSDDACHSILESLFRIVRSDKPKYARSASSKTKSDSYSRLENTAKALRAVTKGVGARLKQKTAVAVLDHIVDSLPDVDEGFCKPLQRYYLKSFSFLLGHPSRCEHLRHRQWQTYIDFVLENISAALENGLDDDDANSLQHQSMNSRNGQSMSLRLSQSSAGRNAHQASGGRSEDDDQPLLRDLLTALKSLTGATNAPTITRLKPILDLTVQWLETESQWEELAFDIINDMLPLALAEDISLAAKCVDKLFLLIRQRHLWIKKSLALRENMLTTMTLCRSLYYNATWNTSLLTASSLEQLLHVIRHEYENRTDRDRLRIDDLNFRSIVSPSGLSLDGIEAAFDTFRDKTEDSRVANNWATVMIMAQLMVGISKKRSVAERSVQVESTPKRRRIDNPIDDLFRQATTSNSATQVVALQVALFVVGYEQTVSDASVNCFLSLHLTDLEDEPATAAWICLLLARIAQLSHWQNGLHMEFWRRVWLWASRASAIATTTRSACYLLHAMTRSSVIRSSLSAKVVCETIFPDGANGPNGLTDSAFLLLEGIINSTLLDTEKSYKLFASHTLRWLDNQWSIAPDRLHNAQIASYARSDNLYTLLMSIGSGRSKLLPKLAPCSSSSICKALLIDANDLAFTRYILSQQTTATHNSATAETSAIAYSPPLTTLKYLKQTIIDLLENKIKSLSALCQGSKEERSIAVSLDVVEVATTACVLGHAVGRELGSDQDLSSLQASVKPLWEFVCTFLTKQPRDDFRRAFSKVAVRLTDLRIPRVLNPTQQVAPRAELSTSLYDLLDHISESQKQVIILDQAFDSERPKDSQTTSVQKASEMIRSDLAVSSTIDVAFALQCMMLKLDMAYALAEHNPEISYASMVVDAILTLEPEELLSSRDLINEFLDGDVLMTRSDAARLLTKLAEVCLQEVEYERCEAALCLCLRVTLRLVPLWTSGEDDELTNVGYDIYEWFVNIALGKGIASQRVLLAMASLLQSVLRSSPVYGTEGLPSARTSLLHILSTAHIALKFQLTDHLSDLFNGYVLSEHSAVFDDIIDNLPSDPDHTEGIALRLYFIANLGGKWYTILRQAVYHIFETAANVSSTIVIAAKCVEDVCRKLHLQSSQQLLRLFAPQVLYTWLEKQGMDSIPFRTFGYETLAALQVDIQDELTAQIAMRVSTDRTQHVVHSLGSSWDSLIERWFAKVVAYTIIFDVAIHRSASDIGRAEMSLVQQLGEDVYAKFCRASFAKAISTIILHLSDDRGFEKVQGENGSGTSYATTYKTICKLSSSQMQLAPGQQPSFRAKHIIQVLDRMCMRSQETLESCWTPALLLHTYRTLLADAKPAFGPLHTCSILRKLRVVICLAGPVALSGYPLLMLLHALRPFLTQFHSSEDAFGIVWYLLDQGKTYLKQKLSFVTGLCVAIFASLSRFASSSQESTTQESHFTSTMNKAQEFRRWLGKYLEDFAGDETDSNVKLSFDSIISAAKQVTKTGNSARATVEGSLLYHLLADHASEQPLLSDTFFHLTLGSLCHDFQATADFRDDILFDDEDVLRMSPVLLSILEQESPQRAFRIWVSQALGRAYALRGPSITELNGKSARWLMPSNKTDVVVEDSYQSIVNVLGDLLWDEDGITASAAEATLQSIFSALPSSNRAIVLGDAIDQSTFEEIRFVNLPCPSVDASLSEGQAYSKEQGPKHDGTKWASGIVKTLSQQQPRDPVLSFLPDFIDLVPSIAPALLPHVVHLALHFETDQEQKTKELLTEQFEHVFDVKEDYSKDHVQLVLNCITYLRKCVLPTESTMAKRNTWLGLDFGAAATAALHCGLYQTALLMLEIHVSQHTLANTRSSRRSSLGDLNMVPDVLNRIYQSVDDPDFFYGTHEESDVASIVEKLSHEGHGHKALSFQSALFDSNIRTGGMGFALKESGGNTVSILNLANMSGLSSSIGVYIANEHQETALEHSLQSLLNLHQWNIVQDKALSNYGSAMMTTLRTLSSASQRESIVGATDQSTLVLADLLLKNTSQRAQQVNYWTSLAVLAELKETLRVNNADDLGTLLDKRNIRRAWTEQESFECVEPILLGREAMFATIKSNSHLRNTIGVSAPQAMLLEVKALRTSLSLGHVHEMSQFCLNRAAYLSELLPAATSLGVKVEAAIQYDIANTFWAQQETGASIRILQNLYETNLPDQAIAVQQSEILTDLGSKITQARLDRPDEVTAKYLVPAIKALGKETMGSKVGRVFHNFAAFCDNQLRDPDNVDEYERVEKIRDRKLQEVVELETMYKKGDSKTRDTVKAHFSKAKTWFKLDDEELQRLKAHRDRLVRNCLENYLLSLRACPDFPNDVLRFLALWMEQSASTPANSSVGKYLSSVPTYKFAPLMNQLSSRILNEESTFQQLLSDLMYRICEDHPFHSLYQIFATSKSKGAQKDEVANSRHAAATKLSEKVMRKSSAGNLWISIHNSNIQFVRVAQEKFPDKELKTGSKLLLRRLPQGAKLEQTIHDMHHKIPPPTMKVEIRPSKDYSSVPTISKFDPQISIAGGVSAPKVITIVAADGSKHKMLLKGGNDDLRQDSIMEQVFEQVSNLLKDHRPTRQRKLGIRTYKVIPLTHNAGIIEFVRDTMPLHDYILPAHTRYYPKDYKPNKCRKEIADAQSKPLPQRLQAYRNVVSNFHPVMRFFFMEHFLDPDDWFQKRLNYSRSTAAISMLGHVLGLGDRHGHNILLDTKTGEVVHIDLGVAFEAGRVLPVPEVVPFRLTRDLVDGMGLSGVEGVFRRCCNFTLEALRRNQEAIMTILDVLRWDPLYSWSVSPLRLARMQENQEQAAKVEESTAATTSDLGAPTVAGLDAAVKRNNVNEPSEADRALAVVSKKLGKSLSVEATVNELIRQAMDERNLAVLYCGWAAYA